MARAKPTTKGWDRTIFTLEEIDRMENVFVNEGCASNIRNRTIISTLFRTQVRINELLSLRMCDVDLSLGTMRVIFGKGAKSRVVGIPRTAILRLKSWELARQARLDEVGVTCDWYFCNLRRPQCGTRMKRKQVWKMFKRVAERADIPKHKRVYLHALRHSGAYHMINYDIDIRTIRQQLGHSSLKWTYHYCEGLNPKLQLDAIRLKAQF